MINKNSKHRDETLGHPCVERKKIKIYVNKLVGQVSGRAIIGKTEPYP